MWLFWAVMAMLGSMTWYLAPKFFPSENPFSPILISGIAAILIGLIFSKIFYRTWFDTASIPLGIALSFVWIATIGLILAMNAGGKIGPIAVIIELSIIFAVLIASFYFREHLNWIQIFGIFLAISGISLVLFFEK